MGKYNPHAPTILGQEWVPLREEPYTLDHEVERGHSFILDTATTVVSGSFFVDQLPANAFNAQTPMMSVYRRGEEHLTGPLKVVYIPAVSGIPFGDGDVGVSDGVTFAEALRQPNDNDMISFFCDTTLNQTAELAMKFDVNSFSSLLSGKRIVQVNVVYALSAGPPDNENRILRLVLRQGSSTDSPFPAPVLTSIEPTQITSVGRTALGNVNFFTDTATPGQQFRKFPMRFQDLQRYALGAANPLSIVWYVFGYGATSLADSVFLTYTALEVIYCEETRLLYGGRWSATSNSSLPELPFVPQLGQNVVQLRPSDTFAVTGKVLTPGEYTVTITLGDTGDYRNFSGGGYLTKALRQKYALPTHDGVEVITANREGRSFSQRELDVLPQLALHTSSTVVTGVHAFGQHALGNVYDGVDVAPDIVMRSGGAAVAYPQVRFYARRFGDTNAALVLRQVGAPTRQVSVSADELDALPELADGWREVTLRFPVNATPLFSDTSVSATWEWVADGLDAGNQWQIMTPRGESFSTAPFDTDRATYGGTSAFTLITGQSISESADSTLIFSLDPPAVTGFAAAAAEQSLEPIGDECSTDPRCVPTALYYNRLSWSARDVYDPFEDRVVVNSWGVTPENQQWTNANGSADDYFVVSGFAGMNVDSINTIYFSTLEAQAYNVEHHAVVRIPIVPTGASVTARVLGRLESTNDYYEAQLAISTAGVPTLNLTKRVGGTGAVISGTTTIDGLHSANDAWHIVLRCEFDSILGQAWKDGYPRPLGWQAVGNIVQGDGVVGTGGGVAFRSESGFLGGTILVRWEEFSSTSLDITAFELQRSDTVDDEWHTVMRSTGTAIDGFSDYEARAGYTSFYRIRTVNALDFFGPWSTEVTGFVPASAVAGITDSGNSVLTFTTNERQDGSSNLAYVQIWSGDVSEDVAFSEAGQVQLRDLYRRDYPVAFHPLERGGEQFSRDILVQNAAVPSGLIRDGFRSLRDMAWDDVSYICVRNELGDRWFANVRVPSGKIQRNRRLYVARIDVAEVSDVPSVVDPTEDS